MKITRRSPHTGTASTMDLPITEGQIRAWQGGELIQDVMPTLSPDEREFLKTGYTPADWQEIFGGDS